MLLFYVFIALIAGIALASQSAINTQLAKAMSGESIIAAFISFAVAVGTLVLLVIAWIKTDLWNNLSTLPQQSWWKLIGGVLGALFVFTTILLAPKIGITAMLFFIIVGQLLAAAVIDNFGLIGMPVREINMTKFIGLFIVACGLAFYFFGDKLIHLLRG